MPIPFNPFKRRRFKSIQFKPPQPEDLLQRLDGTQVDVGTFVFGNYILVPKTQTVSNEYQCFFKCDIIPRAPSPITEVLYSRSGTSNLYFTSGGLDLYFGYTANVQVGTCIDGQINHIELYLKDNGFYAIVNGIKSAEIIQSASLVTTTQYYVNSVGGNLRGSNLLFSFSDCSEIYEASNGFQGSGGTATTLIDPNNATFTQKYLPDNHGSNFALLEIATGLINPNPNDNADLTAKGFLNQFYTRAELDLKHDGEVDFTTPIPEDSALPSDVYRALIYKTGTVLTELKKVKNIVYVGRSLRRLDFSDYKNSFYLGV